MNRVQFGIGDTWKDIQDSVPSKGSKIYALNAMQGQVMSVSIVGGYFSLQVQGQNGTRLCPTQPNAECSFWRGTLPVSQDYFVTVKSGGTDTDFTLRVAINPPGKAEQTFAYNANNFSLSYTDMFAPADALSVLNNKTDLQMTLRLIDTNAYANTNLIEAYFVFGSSRESQIVATCTQVGQGGGVPETINGSVKFNGYNFTYSTAVGAGAGNIYSEDIYRVANNGTCYEAIYLIHYGNISNYAPSVKEFDLKGLLQRFNQILSTVRLK